MEDITAQAKVKVVYQHTSAGHLSTICRCTSNVVVRHVQSDVHNIAKKGVLIYTLNLTQSTC